MKLTHGGRAAAAALLLAFIGVGTWVWILSMPDMARAASPRPPAPGKNTYRAAFTFTCPVGEGMEIIGAANKRIKVKSVRVKANSSTLMTINKRSAANTAGSGSTTATNVPVNTNLPAASATIKYYTGAGTAGTLVGAVACYLLSSSEYAAPAFTFGPLGTAVNEVADLELLSASESLTFNFNVSTAVYVTIEWVEEGA